MKTLLIYPYCLEDRLREEDVRVPPIGLYYIGALLKENGFETDILNCHGMRGRPDLIREQLLEQKASLIGISILNANRWGGLEIAAMAKEIDPHVKVVFGGVGATFLYELFLKNFRQVDAVVLGEGEYAFLDIARWVEDRSFCLLDEIKGIAFRREGEIIKTEEAPFISNLDTLPVPSGYFDYQHVCSSRGCPNSCSFCGSPRFWGNRVRFHSPEYFVGQLELLFKRGTSFFYFSDDTFTINRVRAIEICREIIERGLAISWAAISRVDYVDEDLLFWMRKAGCTQISYGVESGSETIRNSVLKKNLKREDIKKAFFLTQSFGILARAYIIYGSPKETSDTIHKTIALLEEIKPLAAVFYILDLFPGTELYEDIKKDKKFTDDIWLNRIEDIMYFESDGALSKEKVLEFGAALREYYFSRLTHFAEKLVLIENRGMDALHADFLSRLGLTFSHGDYSEISGIRDADAAAEKLFRRSLSYFKDHRAYLGLGTALQRKGDFTGSINVLSEGLESFPESEDLSICRGISYFNLDKWSEALEDVLPFKDSPVASHYAELCLRFLNN